MAKKLTWAAIENAKAMDHRYEKADGGCPGLYLVVQPTGAKNWAVRFRSPIERDKHGQRKAKKLTLGPLALRDTDDEPQIGKPLSLSQARMLATQALVQVKRKKDPTHERRTEVAASKAELPKDDGTVDTAMVSFLTRYKGKKRQGLRESSRALSAYYLGLRRDPDDSTKWKKTGGGVLGEWSGRPLGAITKGDVIRLVEKMADERGGVTSNRTLTTLKTFFGWTVKQDMLPVSPAAMVDAVGVEESRERVLTDVELAAVWKAATAEPYPFGPLVRLLVLTGARRDEVRKAPWSEFDIPARLWTLPKNRTKNGREHTVPLSDQVLEILQGFPGIKGRRWLFTLTGDGPISGSLSHQKERLDKGVLAELRKTGPKAELPKWTLHDLRRTLATGLQNLKFPIEVMEAVLNHRGGVFKGVAGVYGRSTYLPEKTEALAAWARHVDRIVSGGSSATVASLVTRRARSK